MPETALICLSLAVISLLYGSVGQGGASGYIAVMALFGFLPETIKPTALVLNIFVSTLVAVRFWVAGQVSWRRLWPFVVASVPAAFAGGYLTLPFRSFNLILGALLLIAGLPMIGRRRPHGITAPRAPHPLLAMSAGGTIGLLSGLTGMGGGVLLSPLLLYCRWCHVREASGFASTFILLNSLVALAGYWTTGSALPADWSLLALSAVFGGAIGAELGCRYLSEAAICRLLGVVLVIAGARLIAF
jgi:uncharacterized protein